MGIRKEIRKHKVRQERKKLIAKYADHASDIEFDWDWKKTHFNRIALVNMLVAKVGGPEVSYLEIGCFGNALFDSVFASKKTGVDPASGGTHPMTSDAFFAQNTDMFDVVFIDGLHEYEQVRRDAENALKFLKPGGWIAFHDLMPRNWKEHHVPMLQDSWTGDCWKVAFDLVRSEDLDFRLAKIDHGVGVLRPKKDGAKVAGDPADMRDKQFDYFANNMGELPICEWEAVKDWVQGA
ncbi:class I SAM-dependent methyltransferase [Thalassospira sp. MA62]|nr:class I SAM-dependent methyltransferase [Thalassospira sp. MA62]